MALSALLRQIEVPPPAKDGAAVEPDAAADPIRSMKPPHAVKRAREALDAARVVRDERQAELRAMIARNDNGSVTPRDIAPLEAAIRAAGEKVKAARGDLTAAIAEWAPGLHRMLAPHRAEAAAQIVEAVNVIEEALGIIGKCDGVTARWAIEPQVRIDVRDLRALRHSAERIAAAAAR